MNENECLTFNAGINNEKIGIKFISIGTQLFANNNNFLFYTDNKSEKTFHVNTDNNESGIIFENGKRNKFAMNGNKGVSMEFHKMNLQVSNPSNFYFNEKLITEYRNGHDNIISGKDINFIFKEDKLDYKITSAGGDISFNNFKKFLSNGDEILMNCHKNKLELNKYKLSIDTKCIELFVEGKGISIDETLLIMNDEDLKMISKSGNIDLICRNGDKLLISNNKSNGTVEIFGNKFIHKLGNGFINGKSYSIELLDNFSLISQEIKLESQSILIGGNLNVIGDFKSSGNKLDFNFQKYKFNNYLELDEDKFKLNHNNLLLNSKEFEINADRILFKYGANELALEGEGFKYELDNNIFRVLRDEIKIISDGNLGISIGSDRGGIKMSGNIDWVNNGNRILECGFNKIKIGARDWDYNVIGKKLSMIGEIIERKSGIFIESINNGVNWINKKNLFQFNDNILLRSDESMIVIDDMIRLENNENVIDIGRGCLLMQSGNLLMKSLEGEVRLEDSSLILKVNKNYVKLDEKISLFGNINLLNGNAKINLENNGINIETGGGNELYNISLLADRNVMIGGYGLDVDVKNYSGKFSSYYSIIKGDSEMIFAGDNFIKSSVNLLEIGGPNIKVGGLSFGEETLLDVNKLTINADKIDMGKLKIEDGVIIRDGEHELRVLGGEGIELLSKYNCSVVGANMVNIYSKNRILLGNDRVNMRLDRGGLDVSGSFSCSGSSISMGWGGYGGGERVVYLGGELGSLRLCEEVSVLEGRDLRMRGRGSVDVYGKVGSFGFDSFKLDAKNVWIGEGSRIMLNDLGVNIVGKKLRYDGVTVMELGDNFMLDRVGSMLRFGERGMVVNSGDVDWGVSYDIRGDFVVGCGRNLRLDSGVGDVIINTQGCGILCDGVGKIIRMNSEGDIITKGLGRYILNVNDYRLDGNNIELTGRGDLMLRGRRVELGGDLMLGGGRVDIGGVSLGVNVGRGISMVSESCGSLELGGEGVELVSVGSMDLMCENPLGKFRLSCGGLGSLSFGDMGLEVRGRLSGVVEEGISLGTRGVMSLMARELLKLDVGGYMVNFGESEVRGRKQRVELGDYDLEGMNLRCRQVGYGEYRVESDGRVVIKNVMDGHSGRVMELSVEGNSHDESLYIGSRVGGVRIESRLLRVDGVLSVDRIVSGRLRLDGDMELRSVRVGENMFLGERGVSYVERGLYEMRNMDVKLDGSMDVGVLRCDKLDAKRGRLELGGDLVLGGRLDVRGLRVGGSVVGDVGDRGRNFMSIVMGDDYVWNTGIRVDCGGKLGIDLVGDGVVMRAGRVEVGGLMVDMGYGGRMEELGEGDLGALLEGLRVERCEDGRLRMVGGGKVDMLDVMMRVLAVIGIKKSVG